MTKVKKKRGRPSTGFDKKAYDRDRMKRLRAVAKAALSIPKPINPSLPPKE